MAYIYQQFEPSLWTVGTFDGETWIPESDHFSQDEAADRVAFLNGSGAEKLIMEAIGRIEEKLNLLIALKRAEQE